MNDSQKNGCTEKCNNWLEDQKSFRSFLKNKYIMDLILTAIVLITIGVFRCLGFISNDVTGTLAGATIGYAMGGLRKIHE